MPKAGLERSRNGLKRPSAGNDRQALMMVGWKGKICSNMIIAKIVLAAANMPEKIVNLFAGTAFLAKCFIRPIKRGKRRRISWKP